MAFTDPSGDIQAQLTDQARTLIARAILGDVVFQVIGFGLGRGGYDPTDITTVLPIDSTATELDDKVYPTSTPYESQPFQSTEEPTYTVRVYNCYVPAEQIAGNADYALGELALYGQILTSTNDAEIGQTFLYALSHFPVVCKTYRDTFLRRVTISY